MDQFDHAHPCDRADRQTDVLSSWEVLNWGPRQNGFYPACRGVRGPTINNTKEGASLSACPARVPQLSAHVLRKSISRVAMSFLPAVHCLKTRAQSFFMSTTVHPREGAAASAVTSVPLAGGCAS